MKDLLNRRSLSRFTRHVMRVRRSRLLMSMVTMCFRALRSLDREYPDDFKLQAIRGYAENMS